MGFTYSEEHHALLFAWTAKDMARQLGEKDGEAFMRAAARVYGEERGRRMAARARANGHELSMLNYLAYSEYRNTPGSMQMRISERNPNVRACVSRCPWYTTWAEYGLLPWGRWYCLEIDEAVARGFNPDLRLDVLGTRANGADRCEFVFHDAKVTLPNLVLLEYRKRVMPGSGAVMSWEYHTAHLLSTLSRMADELGDRAKEGMRGALEAIANGIGREATQTLLRHGNGDFSRPPTNGAWEAKTD